MKESATALDTMSAMVSALDRPSQLPLGGRGVGGRDSCLYHGKPYISRVYRQVNSMMKNPRFLVMYV